MSNFPRLGVKVPGATIAIILLSTLVTVTPPTAAQSITATASLITAVTTAATSSDSTVVTVTSTATRIFDPGSIGSLIVGRLQAANLVPQNGRLLFEVPHSFASASSLGYSFLQIGRGQHAQNFALGFQVYPMTRGDQAACGVNFRSSANDWHSVLLGSDGRLSVTHQHGVTQTVIYDQVVDQLLTRSSQHSLVLVGINNIFTLYLNGNPAVTFNDDDPSPADGGFALEVFNPATSNALAYCDYVSLWGWSFDPAVLTVTTPPNATTTPTPTATTTPTGTPTVTPTAG